MFENDSFIMFVVIIPIRLQRYRVVDFLIGSVNILSLCLIADFAVALLYPCVVIARNAFYDVVTPPLPPNNVVE